MAGSRRLDQLTPGDDPELVIRVQTAYPIDIKVRDGVYGPALEVWLQEQGFDYYWVNWPRRLAFQDKSQAAATKLQWA